MSTPINSLEKIADPHLYNEDLAPTPKKERNWSWINYSTFWMGIVHNIVAWQVAANLIKIGLSFWQAIAIVTIAYGIAFLAIMFNSVPGAKYGIPFPVAIRASFGHKGAQVPVFLRAFIGVVWFGVHMYITSQATAAILIVSIPSLDTLANFNIIGMNAVNLIAYIISLLLHIYIARHGMQTIKRFELWAGPLIMILAIGLLIWAIDVGNGFGNVVSTPQTISPEKFWSTFILSISALIGTVATLVLNIQDITRFSKSQKDHIIGQGIGLPLMFLVFSFMSVFVTSASKIAFGEFVTNPVDILLQFNHPVIVILGAFSVLVSELSCNVATNLVSAGFDMTNLFPQKLNFRKSGTIAIIIGVVSLPWLWYASDTINNAMGVIGATMGPVTGIILVDFYFIKRQNLDIPSLYVRNSSYSFVNGWNKRALVAMALGVFFALIGLIVPSLSTLYNFNWIIGVAVGGLSYLWLMWGSRERDITNTTDYAEVK